MNARDDARWATAVVQQLSALVCSVGFRQAPEERFPTPLQDATDALIYLYENSESLRVDRSRITLSGFSSGANLAITVPLYAHHILNTRGLVKAIVSFYPVLDFFGYPKPKHQAVMEVKRMIPSGLISLQDDAFFFPGIDLKSPYLSPVFAEDKMLATLPQPVIMYICELDELREEAELFCQRLEKLGVAVQRRFLEGASHGFDKQLGQITPFTKEVYADAIARLKKAL